MKFRGYPYKEGEKYFDEESTVFEDDDLHITETEPKAATSTFTYPTPCTRATSEPPTDHREKYLQFHLYEAGIYLCSYLATWVLYAHALSFPE